MYSSRHGTLLEGIRSAAGDKAEILYAKGSNIYYDAETEKAATGIRPLERGDNRQLLDEALRIAARADVIVAALGECAEMSGESVSRTNLEIPDAQQDLLKSSGEDGQTCRTSFVHGSSFGFELGGYKCTFHLECLVWR